jgi:uncharacterized caspase-like protein
VRVKFPKCTSILLLLLAACAYGQEAATTTRGVEPVSSPQQTEVELGPYYALVIGNNNYQYLPKLQTAVSDAKAVAKLLEQTYGFKVKLIIDATRNDIYGAMNEYRRTLNDTSNLLIYYAGHGSEDEDNHEAYWLPVDAQPDNNVNWISADDITADLRAMRARHVLIISDSCYSGAISQSTRGADLGITPRERTAYLLRVLGSKSRTLMASGGKEPVADNGDDEHSVFAGALLRGLSQMQQNEFTADDLFEQFLPAVAGRSAQTPHYSFITNSGHEYGDFVFAKQSSITVASSDAEPVSAVIRKPTPTIDPEAAAITRTLDRYVDAYESESVGELKRVWPTMPSKQEHALKQTFEKAHALRLRLKCADPVIQGDSAINKCSQTMLYTEGGQVQSPRSDNLQISVKKSEQGWLIDNIRGQ